MTYTIVTILNSNVNTVITMLIAKKITRGLLLLVKEFINQFVCVEMKILFPAIHALLMLIVSVRFLNT